VTYPTDPDTEPITEWLIDGVWTDMTTRVRGAIDIRARGRMNEQGVVSPTTASCLMDNSDDELANRNPNSSLFRKIPSGTQVRHRAGDGDNHIHMAYSTIDSSNNTSVRTSDKAALDITGDIEIRVDIRPHTWRPAQRVMILATKHQQAFNQSSWALYLYYTGRVGFLWSPDGTTSAWRFETSSVAIDATTGRLAIKVTLDVNNGAAGTTTRFYTASSIAGTYTQLGSDRITAGTSSIFSSTAAVICGGGDDNVSVFSNGIPFGGRFYGLHVYNSAGSKVADPDFSLWDFDDVTKVDSHSNTWELYGNARVSTPRLRFWGELSSVGHSSDISITDRVAEVSAADLTQRLGTGQQPVSSPLTLNIRPRDGLLGWWPLEDLEFSTKAASGLPGGKPTVLTQDITFGQSSDLPGAARVAVLPDSTSRLRFPPNKGTGTNYVQAIVLFKLSSLPVSETNLFYIGLTGPYVRTIRFQVGASTFRTQLIDADNVTVIDEVGSTFGTGVVVEDEWIAVRIQIEQNGLDIDWATAWYQQGSETFWGYSSNFTATGVGYPTTWLFQTSASSAFNGVQVSHAVIAEQDLGFASDDSGAWANAIDAYAGEYAATRIGRIAANAGIYCEVVGEETLSAQCGAQPIDTPLKVLQDAADADGGVLAGLRDYYGLMFRTRQDLERHIDANLDYDDLAEIPKVLDDGQQIVNRMTITRTGGSSATAEITEGPTSTQDPPDGVGLRGGAATLNVYADTVLPDVANLRARYSSADVPSIPNLGAAYHNPATYPATTAGLEVMHLDVGATVAVDGWPSNLPPDQLLFLVQGYEETLAKFLWSQRMNTTPAGPYQTGLYDVGHQVTGATRWGSSSSSLNAGITTTATTIVVKGTARVTTVEVWSTTSSSYPVDVMIGGEQIRLESAPTGGTSPQTFNGVTRSVNGIVAAHDADDPVTLFPETSYAL
jgi:hypothetical protein